MVGEFSNCLLEALLVELQLRELCALVFVQYGAVQSYAALVYCAGREWNHLLCVQLGEQSAISIQSFA